MKRKLNFAIAMAFLIPIVLMTSGPALAQEDSQPDLMISTTYPSQIIEPEESVNLTITVSALGVSQTVEMVMDEIPTGWESTFRGSGRIINSVFVEAGSSETVDLRLDPPEDVEPGSYNFTILARSETKRAELEITLTVQEKVPASLSFKTDLPTIKGSPTTTFRYTATLKNEGDQELTINLNADTPSGFTTKFKVSGQEVTSFPLAANQSKTISIELDPIVEVSADSYPFTIFATGGDLQESLNLTAEVTGQHSLSISGQDGRLSTKANAGKATSLQIVVRNTGTAPAQGVELSSTAPTGWIVSFDPEVIAEIPADEQVEVTARLTPAEKAIAGDYMITVRARPLDGGTESAEFRITVTTSTLWGVIGIALIAVSVGVVALAVMRFGRR